MRLHSPFGRRRAAHCLHLSPRSGGALQEIATANGGNRAAGTSGYEASAEYIERQLEAAGYRRTFRPHRGGGRTSGLSARRTRHHDNGSGTASILEAAIQLKELDLEPINRVRFAFWGGEEAGLIGSDFCVSQLSARQTKNHAVSLNFDMVGSPNLIAHATLTFAMTSSAVNGTAKGNGSSQADLKYKANQLLK